MEITDLSKEQLIRMVGVFLGNVVVHHGMWLTETAQSLGIEKAAELEHEVMRSYALLAARALAPHFNIEMHGLVPRTLAEKSREELILLVGDVARIWAFGDDLWLQAVEKAAGRHRPTRSTTPVGPTLRMQKRSRSVRFSAIGEGYRLWRKPSNCVSIRASTLMNQNGRMTARYSSR